MCHYNLSRAAPGIWRYALICTSAGALWYWSRGIECSGLTGGLRGHLHNCKDED